MGDLVALPVSNLRKLATLWQEEERAFQTVLDVLREGGRFDLVLKLDTFQRVRHRRILRLLMQHVKAASGSAYASADDGAEHGDGGDGGDDPTPRPQKH